MKISAGSRWLPVACAVLFVLALIQAFGQEADDVSAPVQMFKPEPGAVPEAADDELIEVETGAEMEPVGMEELSAPVAEDVPAAEPSAPESVFPEDAVEPPAEDMPEPIEEIPALEAAEPEAGALPEPMEIQEPDVVAPAVTAEEAAVGAAEQETGALPEPVELQEPDVEAPIVSAEEPAEAAMEPLMEEPAAFPLAEESPVETAEPEEPVFEPMEPAAEPPVEAMPEPDVFEPTATEGVVPEPVAEAPVEEMTEPELEPAAESPAVEIAEPEPIVAEPVVQDAVAPAVASSPLVEWTVFKLTCGKCGHVWEESSDHSDCDKPGNCPKCGAPSPAFEKVRAERRAPCGACAKDPGWCQEGRPRPL